MADDFKTQARLKKWTVREFKYDAKAVEMSKADLKKHESRRTKQRVSLDFLPRNEINSLAYHVATSVVGHRTLW